MERSDTKQSFQICKFTDVKVVMLGNVAVGKSSLLKRFLSQRFDEKQETTIGACFFAKIITVNNENIKFQIWDTAGQEKFRALAPMYYKDAQAAVLVYDLTNQKSFESLENWCQELNDNGSKDLTIVIAANKSDLVNQYDIDLQGAYAFAKSHNCILHLTSAKTGEGVEQVFQELAQVISSNNRKKTENIVITKDKKTDKKGKCC